LKCISTDQVIHQFVLMGKCNMELKCNILKTMLPFHSSLYIAVFTGYIILTNSLSSFSFLARDVIYTSRAYATMSMSVCLSVSLSLCLSLCDGSALTHYS